MNKIFSEILFFSFNLILLTSSCKAQFEHPDKHSAELNNSIQYSNDELNTLLSYRMINNPDSIYIYISARQCFRNFN